MQRVAAYGAVGDEFGREVSGNARERDARCLICTEPTGPAEGKAGDQRRRRDRGPTDAIRAALVKAEQPEADEPNQLLAASLNSPEKKIFELLSTEEAVHIDDMIERSGLNSSDVLATLFDVARKGIMRQLRGKQLNKILG